MRNYYYSFEINLENPHVKEHFSAKLPDLVTDDITELCINSRFFTNSAACLEALHEDLNKKVASLKVSKSKNAVTSINETNPLYSNSAEDLAKFKEENPEFDEYLESWNEGEVVRITYTTEEFDEEQPPIINDESAMMFRYTIVAHEDDIVLPDGCSLAIAESSFIH